MLRKVAMIFISVVIVPLGRVVQALAVLLLLVGFLFLRPRPFRTHRLNYL